MKQIHEWLDHKLSSNYTYLKESVTVTHTYRKNAGPHFYYGQVTLVAQPAEDFSFTSQAKWPEDADWDRYVLQGILDVLLTFDLYPILGVHIVLREVQWHPVDSVPIGYYRVAKEATQKILKPGESGWNLTYRLGNQRVSGSP